MSNKKEKRTIIVYDIVVEFHIDNVAMFTVEPTKQNIKKGFSSIKEYLSNLEIEYFYKNLDFFLLFIKNPNKNNPPIISMFTNDMKEYMMFYQKVKSKS